MKFETPAALWALGSLALLILFSLWRQAAARTVVPSLVLWKKIPERNPPIRALRRPRWRLELLLQALAIAAGVAALAGPHVELGEPVPRKIALVFDTSARLLAEGRLERAKEEARGLLARLRPADEVAIYAGSPEPRRLGRVDEVRAVHEHVDPAPLLDVARAQAEEVVYFSDRAPEGVRARLFGSTGGNVGIVGFAASDGEVFARLVNHGAERRVPAELRVDGVGAAFEVLLGPGEQAWRRAGDFSAGRQISLVLSPADHFPLDDAAHAVRWGAARAVVSVTGRPFPPLLRALQAISGVEVRWDPSGAAGDALVAVGLDAAPARGALRVEVRFPESGFAPRRFALKAHPLTAGMKEEQVASARAAALPADGGEALFFADGVPVGVFRAGEGLLRLSFEINPAGWPTTPSFPIFWTNVVDYARRSAQPWEVARTGRPLPLPADVREVEARDRSASWSLSRDRVFLAHMVGEFEARTAGGVRLFWTSLLDAEESDTGGTSRALRWDPADPAGRALQKRPLGGYAAALMLVLAAAAWLLERRGE